MDGIEGALGYIIAILRARTQRDATIDEGTLCTLVVRTLDRHMVSPADLPMSIRSLLAVSDMTLHEEALESDGERSHSMYSIEYVLGVMEKALEMLRA